MCIKLGLDWVNSGRIRGKGLASAGTLLFMNGVDWRI